MSRTRHGYSSDGGAGDRLVSLRRRWFELSWESLTVVPEGSTATDSVYSDEGVFAVADGVDDTPGSGDAALAEIVARRLPLSGYRSLRAALIAASLALSCGPAAPLPERGTASVTIAVWTGIRFIIGHVGDSRAYLWREGRLDQLTRDHLMTVVARSPGQRADPTDARVVRLGQSRSNSWPDVVSVPVAPGDRLLICTDGLWRRVPHDQLCAALEGTPRAACEELGDRLGSHPVENASAVVIGVESAGWPVLGGAGPSAPGKD